MVLLREACGVAANDIAAMIMFTGGGGGFWG